MRIMRPIVRTVDGVRHGVRDLTRLREVATILVRHGFGLLVAGLDLPGLPKASKEEALNAAPSRIAEVLQELGPTYVKLGQVLSTRPDVLPREYCDALQSLQDDVTPLPREVIETVLSKQLGAQWRSRVRSFDDAPLATASIAQVHAAVLDDGREVVFKVQRPSIRAILEADLSILRLLTARIVFEFPEIKSLGLLSLVEEFERTVLSELDFDNERRNMDRFRECFSYDWVVIPEVEQELSTRAVLCMQRLHGVRIRDARAAGYDMSAVGDRFLTVAYDMLFTHGLFHGDLHPGNVLVLPGERLGLLDFGMVGRLSTEMRNDVIFIIFALQRGDHRTIARLMYDIAIKEERIDFREVERDTLELVERHWGDGGSVRDMQLGPFVMDLARKAALRGARVPPDYTMFFKALVTAEGLAKTLIEEVDPIEAARPYVEAMLLERLDVDRIQGELLYSGLSLSAVLRRLPISLSQLLDDLDKQRLRLEIKEVPDENAEQARNVRARRLVFGIGSAALCVAGALMVGAVDPQLHPVVVGVPLISWVCFAGAVLTFTRTA